MDEKEYLKSMQEIMAMYFNEGMNREQAKYHWRQYTTPTKKESTMKLETVHFVNGKNVTNMTTEERIQLIADTEARIVELETITTPSRLITAEVKKCKTFLKDIVALFDEIVVK